MCVGRPCHHALLLPSVAGRRRVLWHNMREEPVLYINGKPYVVREADQPFCNVEYTGMRRTLAAPLAAVAAAAAVKQASAESCCRISSSSSIPETAAWQPTCPADAACASLLRAPCTGYICRGLLCDNLYVLRMLQASTDHVSRTWSSGSSVMYCARHSVMTTTFWSLKRTMT